METPFEFVSVKEEHIVSEDLDKSVDEYNIFSDIPSQVVKLEPESSVANSVKEVKNTDVSDELKHETFEDDQLSILQTNIYGGEDIPSMVALDYIRSITADISSTAGCSTSGSKAKMYV